MFKNVPNVQCSKSAKQNVTIGLQVKHLVNVNSSDII